MDISEWGYILKMKDSSVTMDTGVPYDREGLVVPRRRNMVFKMSMIPIQNYKE